MSPICGRGQHDRVGGDPDDVPGVVLELPQEHDRRCAFGEARGPRPRRTASRPAGSRRRPARGSPTKRANAWAAATGVVEALRRGGIWVHGDVGVDALERRRRGGRLRRASVGGRLVVVVVSSELTGSSSSSVSTMTATTIATTAAAAPRPSSTRLRLSERWASMSFSSIRDRASADGSTREARASMAWRRRSSGVIEGPPVARPAWRGHGGHGSSRRRRRCRAWRRSPPRRGRGSSRSASTSRWRSGSERRAASTRSVIAGRRRGLRRLGGRGDGPEVAPLDAAVAEVRAGAVQHRAAQVGGQPVVAGEVGGRRHTFTKASCTISSQRPRRRRAARRAAPASGSARGRRREVARSSAAVLASTGAIAAIITRTDARPGDRVDDCAPACHTRVPTVRGDGCCLRRCRFRPGLASCRALLGPTTAASAPGHRAQEPGPSAPWSPRSPTGWPRSFPPSPAWSSPGHPPAEPAGAAGLRPGGAARPGRRSTPRACRCGGCSSAARAPPRPGRPRASDGGTRGSRRAARRRRRCCSIDDVATTGATLVGRRAGRSPAPARRVGPRPGGRPGPAGRPEEPGRRV